MSKKDRKIKSPVDFDIGIGEIIPATQEAYHDEFSQAVRKREKTAVTQFKENFLMQLGLRLKNNSQFPTRHEVFVFIVQYFVSEKEYGNRDIDNMAKTVLDVLKKKFYNDDNQVKTLLVGKKMEKRVKQNFAYIAIKELKDGRNVDAVKISGLERSITLFQELKSKRYI